MPQNHPTGTESLTPRNLRRALLRALFVGLGLALPWIAVDLFWEGGASVTQLGYVVWILREGSLGLAAAPVALVEFHYADRADRRRGLVALCAVSWVALVLALLQGSYLTSVLEQTSIPAGVAGLWEALDERLGRFAQVALAGAVVFAIVSGSRWRGHGFKAQLGIAVGCALLINLALVWPLLLAIPMANPTWVVILTERVVPLAIALPLAAWLADVLEERWFGEEGTQNGEPGVPDSLGIPGIPATAEPGTEDMEHGTGDSNWGLARPAQLEGQVQADQDRDSGQ